MYRLILLVFSLFAYGLEIDTSIENNLAKNDVNNRLILARYYLDRNLTKSAKFVNEVLAIDENNSIAKELLYKIEYKKEFYDTFKDKNIDEYYKKLFFENKYDEIKKLSKFLPFIKTDYPKIITAKVFFWDGDYKKTKQILKTIKNKQSLDYLEIEAYLAYYEGDYKLAERDFSILYSATYKMEYAYKLIDTYLFLNKIDKANKLISQLLKRDKNNQKLKNYQKKILEKKQKELNKLREKYKQTGEFKDLQNLVYILLAYNKKDEAYSLLEDYIKKHPRDENAKYWYATYLSWGGDNQKALKILEKLVQNGDYKVKLLTAKIYAWNGDYQKSINYLNDIITNSNNPKLIIDAKETKGLIYYWQQDYKKAKPLLEEVVNKKTSIDAKEALMVMNGDVKPLIKKYKLLVQKEPTNLDYILRVAQYSQAIKDIDTAIEYYEKYYNIKPSLPVAHNLAQLYLIKKNPYKAFSYYEYWAYKKGDADSLYELAENYYYAGYTKSALSVINDILAIDKKHKKALSLKAKIAKFSPKFTQENSKKTLNDVLNEKNAKLLTIANRLYFNGFYEDANTYYKEYLLSNPNDIEVRERYAYSLEFSQDYKKASGEFFLLTWQKKDCNILYHYGYSLEKSSKTKAAKKAYQEALKYAKKPLDKFLKQFIMDWKKAWESQDINQYKKFYTPKYSQNTIWLIKKENIFKSVNFISLYLAGFTLTEDYKEGDYHYYKIRFFQQYTTNKKSDKGYKILLLKCKDKKCLIDKETWEEGEYIPTNYKCYELVSKKLKDFNITIAADYNNQMDINITNSDVNITTIKDSNATTMKELIEANISDYNITTIIDDGVDNNVTIEDNITPIEENTTEIIQPKEETVEENITKEEIKKIAPYKPNQLGFIGEYYRDKDGVKLVDYGLFYKRYPLYIDLKGWRLYKSNDDRVGKYFTLHYDINRFTLGFELGNYEDTNYIYPYISYNGAINIAYFQSITGKDKKSFCAVDENLISNHLVFSKYSGFQTDYLELTNFWWSIEFAKIDTNLEITPQFQYKFYENSYKNIDFYYYLSGWYQYNSKPTDCYYSPDLTDSNYIELHPTYKYLEGVAKLGYSFIESSFLYSYGAKFNNGFLEIGCMRNHSYRDTTANYWYDECKLVTKVKW